jgi:hypothetical protein
MIQIIKPNSTAQQNVNSFSIFLAGSIEMGLAEDWQSRLTSEIEEMDKPITIFNPRRDDWDSSWKQEQSNSQFNYQVNWELNRLEECSFIFMYFSPETKSPISLLELGLFARENKMIVCCPDGFWRKGNVDVVCSRLEIPVFDNLESAIGSLKTKINMHERI